MMHGDVKLGEVSYDEQNGWVAECVSVFRLGTFCLVLE